MAAWAYRLKQPGRVEDQVAYVPIPRTSPVVSHFDPRGESEDGAPEDSVPEARDRQAVDNVSL